MSGRECIEAFFQHLCGNHSKELQDENVEYLYNWVAHALQHPDKRSSHLILHGLQGTGKSLFATEFLPRLFKLRNTNYETFITTNPERDVLGGSYNDILVKCGLVVCEEVSGKDYQEHIDNMKGVITDNKIIIKQRYKDLYCINNKLRFITITNANVNTVMSMDGDDRRQWSCFGLNNRIPDELVKRLFKLSVVDYAKFFQELMERETKSPLYMSEE